MKIHHFIIECHPGSIDGLLGLLTRPLFQELIDVSKPAIKRFTVVKFLVQFFYKKHFPVSVYVGGAWLLTTLHLLSLVTRMSP